MRLRSSLRIAAFVIGFRLIQDEQPRSVTTVCVFLLRYRCAGWGMIEPTEPALEKRLCHWQRR